MERKIWQRDEIKETALGMGKKFEPNPEIVSRLDKDLSDGALVLFTEDDVNKAIADNLVPSEWKDGLLNLVNNLNDIAVIPIESLKK